MPPPIPDRWIPYKACGRTIEGTRIVCFKVPLNRVFQENNSDIMEIWDIGALLEQLPKLGAVVDLTNTHRYYNPNDLKNAGILHKKILIPGHMIPPEEKVKEFMDVMDSFLKQNSDSLVGVHCTHGLNRTGYMVCRYMRDRLNMPAKDAIKKFGKARGYQIERENYINHLLGKPVTEEAEDVEEKRLYRDRMSHRHREHEGKYVRMRFDNEHVSDKEHDGKYVRSRSCKEYQQGISKNGSRERNRSRSDSDRSFDYAYDY